MFISICIYICYTYTNCICILYKAGKETTKRRHHSGRIVAAHSSEHMHGHLSHLGTIIVYGRNEQVQ